MKTPTDDAVSDGVLVHLGTTRLDREIEQETSERFSPEEDDLPTKPGVPKAKGNLAVWKCKHNLRLADCVECALKAEVAGRYSCINSETSPDTKKEK